MAHPLHALANLAATLRDAGREFVQLFAIEGRMASHTAIRITVFAVMAGTFFAVAWLLFSLALAAVLINVYDWTWTEALCLVGGVHAVAALGLGLAARHAASAPFFPRTLAQLNGSLAPGAGHGLIDAADNARERVKLSTGRVAHSVAGVPASTHRAAIPTAGELRAELRRHDQQLLTARGNIEKQFAASKSAARAGLTHPAVIAAAVGLGLLLGLKGKNARRMRVPVMQPVVVQSRPPRLSHRAPSLLRESLVLAALGGVGGQLRRAAVAQGSAYAFGLIASWLQRRERRAQAAPRAGERAALAVRAVRASAPPLGERRRGPTVLRLVHERRATTEPRIGETQ